MGVFKQFIKLMFDPRADWIYKKHRIKMYLGETSPWYHIFRRRWE